jgi:hypothetical protein
MADMQNSYHVSRGGTSRRSARRETGSACPVFLRRNFEALLAVPAVADRSPEPTPIWLAALMAARCQAVADGGGQPVRWDHVSGRALYTNLRCETETIEPLGVRLQQGQTIAVSWTPGETAYTVEVYRQYDLCA